MTLTGPIVWLSSSYFLTAHHQHHLYFVSVNYASLISLSWETCIIVPWIIFTGRRGLFDPKSHSIIHPELIFPVFTFLFLYAFHTRQSDSNILVDSKLLALDHKSLSVAKYVNT